MTSIQGLSQEAYRTWSALRFDRLIVLWDLSQTVTLAEILWIVQVQLLLFWDRLINKRSGLSPSARQ